MITWSDFEKVELRAGTIIGAEDFPRAKKHAHNLLIDLGDLGVRRSSAQIAALYKKDELLSRQVIPPKQIADFLSEVLTTGFILPDGVVVLSQPERRVPNGTKLA